MANFEEMQKFRQIWLWLVLLGLAAVSWYCFIEQIVLGKVVGSKPAPNEVVWVMWGVGAILIPGLFVFMNLKVTVEEGTLFIRFWPFDSRTVLVMDIEGKSREVINKLTERLGNFGKILCPLLILGNKSFDDFIIYHGYKI